MKRSLYAGPEFAEEASPLVGRTVARTATAGVACGIAEGEALLYSASKGYSLPAFRVPGQGGRRLLLFGAVDRCGDPAGSRLRMNPPGKKRDDAAAVGRRKAAGAYLCRDD